MSEYIEKENAVMYARPEYLNPITEYAKGWNDAIKEYCCNIREIEALAEPKWIPVTERLPKAEYGESKPVLVTECWKYDNGTSFAIRTAEYDGGAWHDGTGNVFTETKVIAWMPLPDPYKESEE